jgi:hypothetical protein
MREAVDAAGGQVLGSAAGTLHARVPTTSTESLGGHGGVASVTPAPVLHQYVESDGVATTGASAWHADGTDGTGVDIAIVDAGFLGYQDKIGIGELPAGTLTSFGSCAQSDLTDHGTYVAEIAHDMAPGATIHLVCVDSPFDLDSTNDPVMAYLRNNGIEVANASLGFNVTSRGDGQGAIDRAVAQSRRDGTLWTVAAGNEAQLHTRLPKGSSTAAITGDGALVEAVDVNPGTGTDRWMSIVVGPGDGDPNTAEAGIEMKWEGWTDGGTTDFDVYAFTEPILGEYYFANGSSLDQSAGDSVKPVEGFFLSNPITAPKTFYILIDAYKPASAAIDFWAYGDIGSIEYPIAAGSVAEPGTSPGALTVGAACVMDGALEPYSSQGPTMDGRVKPDIVGPDGVDTSALVIGTCDGFRGTSAAAPHVAGAAALVLDAQPGLDAGEVQAVLERRATPAGAAGKDNLWGWGKLAMGPPDAPSAPDGDLYTALSPSDRLVDTRTANQPLGSGATRRFAIAGTHGVPADATAVTLNVTAVAPTAAGYLTAFPAGAARPVASNLNFAAGAVVANSVTVGLGTNGSIDLFNYAGSTNVVIDIVGWYGPTGATGLASLAPIRAVDTRAGKPTRIGVPGGAFGGSEVLRVQLAGNAAIPEVPASATAVVLNVTVVAPTRSAHLTVWPTGLPKPTASSVNFPAGATVANLVPATIGQGGQVDLAVSFGTADAVLDVVGYYSATAPGRFVALPTVFRISDTRTGNGGPVAPIGSGLSRGFEATSLNGVPLDATGVVVNLTAVAPTATTGHLSVWGAGPTPTSSTLNFTKGAVVANAAVVGLGASAVLQDGFVGVLNSSGQTQVVLDLAGYFVAGP